MPSLAAEIDWVKIYAAGLATILGVKDLILLYRNHHKEHKNRALLRFDVGLGPEDVHRVAAMSQTERGFAAQVSRERPLALVITNEGGSSCLIRKIIVNGSEKQSKRLPISLPPGERSWSEIGFPDEYKGVIQLELEENTGKKHKQMFTLPGMYTDIGYLFGLKE